MKHISISVLFSICLTCSLSAIAYGAGPPLALRLVHPDHDRIAHFSPDQVKVDRKLYEHFKKGNQHYWVSRKVELDITDMTDARVNVQAPPSKKEIERLQKQYPNAVFPTEPSYEVTITLSPRGREKISTLTANNIKRRLAVVFNGKLLMAPVIMDKITGDVFVVSGFSNYEEAKSLTDAIKGGSRR